MYVCYILLSIFALTRTVECQGWWDIIKKILDKAIPSEDSQLDIDQLTYKYGYDLEVHQVVTEDSYIINFHRIPKENGPVVFLMHGLTDSADCWLLQGYTSLGYVLSERGFDVWMGNARGNKYSSEHTIYNSTSQEFWRFSWEEIGLYDLPAMIDYILEMTGKNSLYYVGHSQGTTTGYVLLSMKPEYNQKIKVMFSLAPVAWMTNVRSVIMKVFSTAAMRIPSVLLQSFLSPGSFFFNRVTPYLCKWSPIRCENLLRSIMGFEHKTNKTLWPIILGHMPTGASLLQFVHYGQLVHSKRFCRFDYGKKRNIMMYGQDTPPDYDLDMIRAPVVLYYSDKDWLSSVKDVITLKSKLPNVLDVIFLKDYGHIDYLYSEDARRDVFHRIVAQIKVVEKRGKRKHKRTEV